MIRKIFISSIIAFIIFCIVALMGVFTMLSNKEAFLPITWLITFICFVISFITVKAGKSSGEMASNALDSVKGIQANIELKDANLYAIAEKEYEDGQINQGLWSQALVKAKGDETLRKVEYMKLRVMQLKQK
jgi:hypothetical protein